MVGSSNNGVAWLHLTEVEILDNHAEAINKVAETELHSETGEWIKLHSHPKFLSTGITISKKPTKSFFPLSPRLN